MSLSIQGKTAIVTGAARGIGLAIARHFQEAGANVVFADSDKSALEAELGDGFSASDGPVRAFAGDLTQKLTLANLVSASIDAFERIDILVNAHRAVQPCDPLSLSDDLLGDMLRQNMISGLKLSQMVARRIGGPGRGARGRGARAERRHRQCPFAGRRPARGPTCWPIPSPAPPRPRPPGRWPWRWRGTASG